MSQTHTAIATLVLALTAMPTVHGQTATPPIPWANKFFLPGIATDPSRPAPPVVTHDFGTVPHGTLCVHKFTITNIYDVPMQVVDVKRSCGCLEAYPPQKVLEPNEQADFIVTMDTTKFKGPNSQTVHVTFGPKFISTAILRVSASSRADVMLNPGRVHFGTVAQGAKADQTVTLEYSGKDVRTWQVTGVVPPAGPLQVDVTEVSRGGFATGTKYQIGVRLKPNAPAGRVAEVVTLTTNDPTAPVVQVNVTGIIQAPLTLSTERVQFTGVKVGETTEFKVLVRGTTPFRVAGQPTDADGLAVETFPAAAPVQVVTVKFTPTKPGPLKKTLTLQSDAGTAVIHVEAEAVP